MLPMHCLSLTDNQSCVLAPMLFSMMLRAILSETFCSDDETSIKIRFRINETLFNMQRLQAKIKIEENAVHYFLFVNDCTLNTTTKAQMQQRINSFLQPATTLASKSVLVKKEVMH